MRFGTKTAQTGLLVLCLALTVFSFFTVRNAAEDRSRAAFGALVTDSQDAFLARLKSYRQNLVGLGGLFVASEQVTKDDFALYAAQLQLDESMPAALGVGYLAPVARQALPAYLETARTDGAGRLEIWPDTGLDELFITKYYQEYEASTLRAGFDMASHDGCRAAAQLSRDSGAPQISPVQQPEGGVREFHLLLPVYRTGPPPETAAARREFFMGWVFAAFAGEQAFDRITATQSNLFHLRAYDASATGARSLIYDSAEAGFDRNAAAFTATAQLEVMGRRWILDWASTPEFDASQKDFTAAIILLAGAVLTLLFWLLFRNTTRREADVNRKVAEVTSDLRNSEQENSAIVENARAGIVLVDGGQTVLGCNRAGLDMLGRDASDVVGRDLAELFPALDPSADSGIFEFDPMTKDGDAPECLTLEFQKSAWRAADGQARGMLILHDVSQEARAKAQIAETERRFDLAMKGAEIGVFDIDLTTGKSVVSDTWRQLMAVPLDDADFDTQANFLSRIHPEDYPALQAADAACLRGETERSVAQYRVKFSGDRWRWMRSDAVVVERDRAGAPLRMVGTQADITEEIRAQIKLKHSEERFRLIFSHAPVGNAVIDHMGNFILINDALTLLLGYSERELKEECRFRDFVSEEDLKNILTEVERCKADGIHALEVETELRRKDGTTCWGLMSLAWTLDEHTGEDIFILQVNDISEKQQVEHMKSVFVATVSHELRTPLTSIRGALAILDDSAGAELSSSGRRLLDIAQTNSDRLIELVNDILDLERIETGRLEFAFSKESARELMEEAQAQILPYASRLGIKVELNVPEDEDILVWCDRARIAQVFGNLVSNSCKFSKSGSTVTIDAQKEGKFVKFLVRDEGQGVPDSFRSNIFKPFSQADGTDTRQKGGTGLGLSIAKQLVERMGGKIGYDSVPNVETVFWFTTVLHDESLEDQSHVLGRMAMRV